MENPDLAILVKLKDVDARRLETKQRIRAIQMEIANIEKTLASGSGDVAEIEEAMTERRRERDKLDLNVKTFDSHIGKLKQQLLTVRTNREYEALRNEIGKEEADRSRAEDRILQAMMDLDTLGETLKTAQQALARGHEELEQTKRETLHQLEELKGLVAQADQARSVLLGQLKPEVSTMYERILALRGDAAVASADPDRRVCDGCYSTITLQMVSELMLARDLVQCQSCNRYLYLASVAAEEDSSTTAAAKN